jgi:hypothetical protein
VTQNGMRKSETGERCSNCSSPAPSVTPLPKPLSAAAKASSRSVLSACATLPMASSVAGSKPRIDLPEALPRYFPSMCSNTSEYVTIFSVVESNACQLASTRWVWNGASPQCRWRSNVSAVGVLIFEFAGVRRIQCAGRRGSIIGNAGENSSNVASRSRTFWGHPIF